MLKRILDIFVSSVGLLILGLPMLLTAVLIRLGGPGPALFIQDRLGLNLHTFRMLKFRSMVDKAEHLGTGLFSYEDDYRITPIGHFLRRTSTDELPQLINVLRGDMSMVGPRPPVTYELGPIEHFTDTMKIRFQVKPGITGLAQIEGRNDLSWDEKITYDNRYVALYQKWGVLIDIVILFRTVWVVVQARNIIEKRPET